MNFFKTDTEVKERERIKELARTVRAGVDLRKLKADDVLAMQEYALDIKDIQLYDYLDIFWRGV